MNKKEYGFLIKLLFFLGNLGIHTLFQLTGEYRGYKDYARELVELEKEYKKEIQ